MSMEITEIARYDLIKNAVVMSGTKVYVELGTRDFTQIKAGKHFISFEPLHGKIDMEMLLVF